MQCMEVFGHAASVLNSNDRYLMDPKHNLLGDWHKAASLLTCTIV